MNYYCVICKKNSHIMVSNKNNLKSKKTNTILLSIIIVLSVGILLNILSNFSVWSTALLASSLFVSTYLLKTLNIKL